MEIRTVLRWGYLVLAWAVVADLCLQFYFAAYGAFSPGRAGFAGHSANANLVMLLMLAALLVAIVSAATGGLGWARVIGHVVLPLLVVGQIVILAIGAALGTNAALLGLHGLNGVAMLLLSLWLAVGAVRLVRTDSRGPHAADLGQ
jgi:hypothetical protein